MVTIQQKTEFEAEIKKSRFRATVMRVDSGEEICIRLSEARDPTASHNCWAYRIGDQYRFSDDGEPGGSAGRPILTAIDGQGLDHLLVVVSRHFGGVKLGVGGLVRAYGGTAAECLRRAVKVELHPAAEVEIRIPFADEDRVYQFLEEKGASIVRKTYEADGPRIQFQVEARLVEILRSQILDLTRGQAQWRKAGG